MTAKDAILLFASQRAPRLSSRVLASSGYTLDLESFGSDAFTIWAPQTAVRQDRAWQPLIARAKAGAPREDIAALQAAIDRLAQAGDRVLEVGCGGGYNSEIIIDRVPDVEYTGVDISEHMVDIAREHYPLRQFLVGNAYDLSFAPQSFDILVDGVALLHMTEWKSALTEYARVARRAVVLHGVTVTDAPTTVFGKYAYGQPSLELVFNRDELLEACASRDLVRTDVLPGLDYDLRAFIGIESVSETWLLAKSTT